MDICNDVPVVCEQKQGGLGPNTPLSSALGTHLPNGGGLSGIAPIDANGVESYRKKVGQFFESGRCTFTGSQSDAEGIEKLALQWQMLRYCLVYEKLLLPLPRYQIVTNMTGPRFVLEKVLATMVASRMVPISCHAPDCTTNSTQDVVDSTHGQTNLYDRNEQPPDVVHIMAANTKSNFDA
jgi:hypothetical protein